MKYLKTVGNAAPFDTDHLVPGLPESWQEKLFEWNAVHCSQQKIEFAAKQLPYCCSECSLVAAEPLLWILSANCERRVIGRVAHLMLSASGPGVTADGSRLAAK
jgi:hypothetical protein